MIEAFWMVWCVGDRSPSVKHTTEEAACNEAARLANANPRKEFFVLEAKGRYQGNVIVSAEPCSAFARTVIASALTL